MYAKYFNQMLFFFYMCALPGLFLIYLAIVAILNVKGGVFSRFIIHA